MGQQQQNQELTAKDKFNITFNILTWHGWGVILGARRECGSEALGRPAAFAFGLMMLWYLVTADPGMLLWIGMWLCMLVVRRIEAVKLTRAGKVHSHSQGVPVTALKFTKSLYVARAFIEPLMVGSLGVMAFLFYQEMGWRSTGLPYFLLAGIVSLPYVEMIQRTICERQLQAMRDGQLDQQALLDSFKNRFGG